MLHNARRARRARRAATVVLTAAFGVPVFAADGVIGTWMSGAGPSAKTYVFKTHDNTFIGTVCGPCDDPSNVFRVADGTVTDAGHVSFLIVGRDGGSIRRCSGSCPTRCAPDLRAVSADPEPGRPDAGPFVPRLNHDHVWRSELMIGVSLALSTAMAATLMTVLPAGAMSMAAAGSVDAQSAVLSEGGRDDGHGRITERRSAFDAPITAHPRARAEPERSPSSGASSSAGRRSIGSLAAACKPWHAPSAAAMAALDRHWRMTADCVYHPRRGL
jgi:hypothetical protein